MLLRVFADNSLNIHISKLHDLLYAAQWVGFFQPLLVLCVIVVLAIVQLCVPMLRTENIVTSAVEGQETYLP